ncbi:MAG: hypothetical protein ACI9JM_001245 [Halioglobus sp.]|jgi:hypothetical protein
MGSKSTVVPGFADPLGTGIDPAMRVFSGRVHFMDLLGDYGETASIHVQEIQLSPNALSGIDMRSDLLTDILEGKKRGFDRTVFNLTKTTVQDRYGLPVTTETSPLSLAGFGSVNEMQKPVETLWNQCKGQRKRLFVLEDVPKRMRKYYKPNPKSCFEI